MIAPVRGILLARNALLNLATGVLLLLLNLLASDCLGHGIFPRVGGCADVCTKRASGLPKAKGR